MQIPSSIPGMVLTRVCGHGGGGTVWFGHTADGSARAVKIISPGRAAEKAQKAVAIYQQIVPGHPALIHIHSAGYAGEFFFYVMELADNASSIPGEYIPDTLAHRLKQGRLPLTEAVLLMQKIVAGTAQLHAHGYAHRDLKPENILFIRGEVKIGDPDLLCGLSHCSAAGTPEYSPVSSTAAGGRDLYALGRMLYCMFTGESPVMYPALPEDLPFGKFGSLNRIALRCCDPGENRYCNINELQNDLKIAAQKIAAPPESHCRHAFLPVVLPLLLIGGNSVAACYKSSLPPEIPAFMACAGNPVVALTLGAFIAVFLIGKCRKSELTVSGIMGKSILEAANILIITAAGGALGEVLKRIDFASFFPDKMEHMGVFALLIPLFAAALVKIAQGSSTLAILTAASITAPLLAPLGLTTPVMRALACCAVCCGAMMVSHTNDSYFWVVTRFSGMNVRQGLKLQTFGTLVSGVAAAIVLMIMAICCF